MASYSDRIWTKGYKLGPYKLATTKEPYPRLAFHKFLDDTVARYPTRPACLYLGNEITYQELKLYVDKLATALADLGVEKGDRVATILPTCPQFIISDYAILKTGAVHVPCSPLHKAPDLIYEVGGSGARVIICLDDSVELVNSIRDKTKLENIIITSIKDYSSEQQEPKRIPGTYQLRDLIAKYDAEPPEVEIDPMEDLAELLFTGGATGLPKGVMLTHYNLTANTIQSIGWLFEPLEGGIRGRASILIGLPASHIYAHWAMWAAIYWGLQMILIPDPRDTDTIIQLLGKHRPFMAPFVPTQYMRLIQKGVKRTTTMFTSGAAPLPLEVAEKFKQQSGMPVAEAYGLTETSPMTHFNLSSFSKITGFMPFIKYGSIGVPIVDTDIKVVDEETGDEVPIGEVGQLYIHGPQVMKGYWPTPGSGLENGWLPTGDIVKMDEDGYFYIVDRIKDMANISGYKVYTTTIEDILFTHPAVSMAVAIGIPDPERPGSERIKAFIKLKEGYEDKVSASEIIELCRGKCPPYAVPKLVEFKEDLPLTTSEKLFKRELREKEIAKFGRKQLPHDVTKWL